jgi:hypothetical protein
MSLNAQASAKLQIDKDHPDSPPILELQVSITADFHTEHVQLEVLLPLLAAPEIEFSRGVFVLKSKAQKPAPAPQAPEQEKAE